MKKNHSLFWGSSYDRGLDVLLYLWPDIKKEFPDAQLHVCYGWDLFLKMNSNNPERMRWYEMTNKMLKQDGVTHYGRVGKNKLKEIREQCGIWAYPTYFKEIDCITAKEVQNQGLVPVTMALAALKETAKVGVLVDGDIHKREVLKRYRTELSDLMRDGKRWKRLSLKCKKFAHKSGWDKTSAAWDLEPRSPQVKLTVYTPTIREGFWNLMADNLSKQTYHNFEWVIVDDYKQNRQETANKYAKKYNLNIKYIRGERGNTKRLYGLSSANNTAMRHATGDVLVALQDFILLQPTALEEIARESERHPNDLIAPVDVYYYPSVIPNLKNKEDWFDGQTKVVGKFLRKNIRIQNKGLRETDNPMDFEMNFGAIPMSVLRELNGWWEFMGDALGFDNTEIAWRALQLGHKIWIDEWNIAICIDHENIVGERENNLNRRRLLNNPRYSYLTSQTSANKLPVKRSQELDDSISLQYKIPKEVKDEDCEEWVNKHNKEIVGRWINE